MRLRLALAILTIAALSTGAFVYLQGRTDAPAAAPVEPSKTASMLLDFAPAPVGQSRSGETDLVPGVAVLTPAVPGGDVVLQRREGKDWVDVMTATQDADGRADVAVDIPYGTAAVRLRAVMYDDGASKPTVKSEVVRVKAKAPVWRDEFTGTQVDPANWSHRQLGLRNPEGNRPCAEGSMDSVWVEDGAVHLQVREIPPAVAQASKEAQPCRHGEFYNGHIGTKRRFSFLYGVMAARIRFPAQQGQHGAFWSQPTKGGGGAEIDAVEYFGDRFPANGPLAGSSAIQHSIYYPSADDTLAKEGGLFDLSHLLDEGETWADDFHVFSVEWTPDEYIFRVDGHETFRTVLGLSDRKQFVILSLLTSDWELPRMNTSKLTPMSVDWVRVWRPQRERT